MIKIPTTFWQQLNLSDLSGNIFASYNCDLVENPGTIRAATRMLLNTNTSDVAEMTGVPIGFKYFSGGIFTGVGASAVGYVLKNSGVPSGNFVKVTGGGAPTTIDSLYSDIELFTNNSNVTELNISGNDGSVYYTTDGVNFSTLTAGAVGSPVLMTAFSNRMYATKGGQKIQSWDVSHSVSSPNSQTANSTSNTVWLIDNNLVISWIKATSSAIWIGTVNINGGRGYVFKWDGSSTSINAAYKLKSGGTVSAVIDDDIPHITEVNGKMSYWNGGNFIEEARLNRVHNKLLYNPFVNANNRFMHPNGMAVINGRINCLIDGVNFDAASHLGTQEVTIPSGIYELDKPNKSFYHKRSFGLSKASGTIKDYGQIRIFGAGGLAEILVTNSVTSNGTFLAGGSYYTDATTTTQGIFFDDSNDTEAKALSLITPKIFSPNIKDTWGNIYARHKRLLNTVDKIQISFRTVDLEPTEVTVNWITTTSFSTTTDVSSYVTGDEVEFIQGIGSGLCSHIVSVQAADSAWIVKLDTVYTGATGTSKARFQHWITLGAQTSLVDMFKNFSVINSATNPAVSTWIQFKIFCLFHGKDEINDFILTNKVHTPAI